MPLTEEQRKALPVLRAMFVNNKVDFGRAMPLEERARLPAAADIPPDITARVEIAPALSTPVPILDPSSLKQPDRVPVFFYSLRSETGMIAPQHTNVILYMHGGGNLHSHPTEDLYINFITALLRATAADSTPCVVIAPCYRLATVSENRFPAAVQDVLAAYDYVISLGYKSSNITVAGDSAGGNHALILTHLVLNSDRPAPQGVVVIAPASLQVYDNLSEQAKAHADTDLLTLGMYQTASSLYILETGFSPTDPLVSGSRLPFTQAWPKTLILVGSGDQLIDASRLLKKRLTEANRPVELVEYDERPHGWWLVLPTFPEEIRDAAQRVARFVALGTVSRGRRRTSGSKL